VKVYGSRAALRPTPLLAPALSRHPAVMRSARRAVIADPSNREPLGLAVYRERGRGRERGAVFFLGGGLLEVSGSSAEPASGAVGLFLQVRDLRAARERLAARGVPIDQEPTVRPCDADQLEGPPARDSTAAAASATWAQRSSASASSASRAGVGSTPSSAVSASLACARSSGGSGVCQPSALARSARAERVRRAFSRVTGSS
jgi:hypothetical protein